MKKSLFTLILAAIILITYSIPCSAAEATTVGFVSNTTQLFKEADDETIVMYLNGVGIKKGDINEDGVINSDALKLAFQQRNNTLASDPSRTRLPRGYTEAIVQKSLVAPQFGQTTTESYLTVQSGRELARTFDFDLYEGFIALLAGFIPVVGTTITIGYFFGSAMEAGLASDIRSYTDDDDSIVWTVAENRYGTFHAVRYWDGLYVDLSESETDVSTETLVSVCYR